MNYGKHGKLNIWNNMKKLKAISHEQGKSPVYNLDASGSNANWIVAGRLKERANKGDKAAKKKLQNMEDEQMILYTWDDLELIRRTVEMENEAEIEDEAEK